MPDVNWLFAAAVQAGAAIVAIPAAVIGGNFIATRSDVATRVQAARQWSADATRFHAERLKEQEGAARPAVDRWILERRVVEALLANDEDAQQYGWSQLSFLAGITTQLEDHERAAVADEYLAGFDDMLTRAREIGANHFWVGRDDARAARKNDSEGVRPLATFTERPEARAEPVLRQYVNACGYLYEVREQIPNASALVIVRQLAEDVEKLRTELVAELKDAQTRHEQTAQRIAREEVRAQERQRLESITARRLAESDDYWWTVVALAAGAALMILPGLYGLVADTAGAIGPTPLWVAILFFLGFAAVLGRVAQLGLPKRAQRLIRDLPTEVPGDAQGTAGRATPS